MDADEQAPDEQLDFDEEVEYEYHEGDDDGYEEEQLQYDDEAHYDEGEGLAGTEQDGEHAADDADEYLEGLEGEAQQRCVQVACTCPGSEFCCPLQRTMLKPSQLSHSRVRLITIRTRSRIIKALVDRRLSTLRSLQIG